MTSQNVVVLDYVVGPDESIIHRDEEVDGYVDEMIVLQEVEGLARSVHFEVPLLSVVKSLKLVLLPAGIEVDAQVSREPKVKEGLHQMGTLEKGRVT